MKLSAVAGSLAALGGILGKLGADGESPLLAFTQGQCRASTVMADLGVSCDALQLVPRVSCIGLMLAANAMMLSFFVKGLHETDSLTATVTSASVNFMLSATGGMLVFGEQLPMQWFAGATIILIGMAFLLHGDTLPEGDASKEKQS